MRLFISCFAAVLVLAGPATVASAASDPARAPERSAAELEAREQYPALRPTPPTEETYALARRMNTFGDPKASLLRGLRMSLAMFGGEKPDPLLEGAVLETLAENGDVWRRLEEASVRVAARHYTDEELRAGIAFFEDPLLSSVRRKQLDGGTGAVLTGEEAAALQAWKGTDAARSMEAKKMQVGMEAMWIALEVIEPLTERVRERYCAEARTPTCRKVKSRPSTRR